MTIKKVYRGDLIENFNEKPKGFIRRNAAGLTLSALILTNIILWPKLQEHNAQKRTEYLQNLRTAPYTMKSTDRIYDLARNLAKPHEKSYQEVLEDIRRINPNIDPGLIKGSEVIKLPVYF